MGDARQGIDAAPAEGGAIEASATVWSRPPDLPPRRQHPAWIVINAVRRMRELAIPAIVLVLSRGDRGEGALLVAAAAVTAISLLWQAIAWRSTRYAIEAGRLRVESGVLSRRERFVPLERIQAVDLEETPLQRLFGVVGVHVETAAGGAAGSDVSLQAVAREEAEALRVRLAAGKAAATGGTGDAAAIGTGEAATAARMAAGPAAGEIVWQLGWREVVVAGATSGQIGPALAVVSFAVQVANDLVPERVWEALALDAPRYGPGGLAVALLVGAVAAWALAIGGAVLTWSGFVLRRDGDRLQIGHGLLDRRRRTVPLARIQAIALRQSPLRRPFGLAEVRFVSAGWGKAAGEAGVLAPLVPLAAVPALLGAAVPAFAPPEQLPPLTGPPPRARARYLAAALLRVAGLVAAAVALAGALPTVRWWWGMAILAVAPLLVGDAWLAWRDSGCAWDGRQFVVRNGGLIDHTTVTRPGRLQERSVAQNPLTRRARLATLSAAVASGGGAGGLRLAHLDEAEAFALLSALNR